MRTLIALLMASASMTAAYAGDFGRTVSSQCQRCSPAYDETPGTKVYLQCVHEPAKNEVCCWAELTAHEWANCKSHWYEFGTVGNKKISYRIHARSGWICAPVGHENFGYKTSTGRHLIAIFSMPR